MFCFTAISTSYIFGTLLTANGNLRQYNLMALCGIVINLVLNLILIPKYFALGSAISSVTTQFFTALAQVFIAKKAFHFKVNQRLLLAMVLFIFGVISINYFTIHLTSHWKINFLIMTISCSLWAFATGMLNVKSFLRFLKYK
jgi:O-antigen/teichoic acid export membrane protein